jgi:hypothetical protein
VGDAMLIAGERLPLGVGLVASCGSIVRDALLAGRAASCAAVATWVLAHERSIAGCVK